MRWHQSEDSTKTSHETQGREKQAKRHHYANCRTSLDLETETTTSQDTNEQTDCSEPTPEQPSVNTGSHRPNIEELNVQTEDDDEDTNPFINTEENPHEPLFKIVINPTGETYTGTSEEATLLKWHYHLGHINM